MFIDIVFSLSIFMDNVFSDILFTIASRQYSGRREASFELSNATISLQRWKLWCSDLAVDNALPLRGEKSELCLLFGLETTVSENCEFATVDVPDRETDRRR